MDMLRDGIRGFHVSTLSGIPMNSRGRSAGGTGRLPPAACAAPAPVGLFSLMEQLDEEDANLGLRNSHFSCIEPACRARPTRLTRIVYIAASQHGDYSTAP